MLSLLFACSAPDDSGLPDSEPLADSPTDSPTDSREHETPECGELTEPEVEPTLPAWTLTSTFTWTLSFDEAAEEAGLEDCSYTRSFEGLEFLDQPWLCPDCAHATAGTATMSEGADCFAQISEDEPDRAEWWGFGAEDGYYRTSRENLVLGELPVTEAERFDEGATVAFANTYELSDGGVLELSATGSMSWAESETLLPDYWAPRQTDYARGWPRANPGDLVAGATLA